MTHEWVIHRETSQKVIVRKMSQNHNDQIEKSVFKWIFVCSLNFFFFILAYSQYSINLGVFKNLHFLILKIINIKKIRSQEFQNGS